MDDLLMSEFDEAEITRTTNAVLAALGDGEKSPIIVAISLAAALWKVAEFFEGNAMKHGDDSFAEMLKMFNEAYDRIRIS